MRVIVDTVIWSLALRRGTPDPKASEGLTALIHEQRVILLGPIRQEVLSGYSDTRKFKRLRDRLSYFDNEPISGLDYVKAAEFHNTCRTQGLQGSHTDFLICACAFRIEGLIYTRDNDFELFCEVLPVSLYKETEG